MRFSSFSLPLLYLTFTASSVLLPHTFAHTHTHTDKGKIPTGLILFSGMKNQSVLSFSLSIIQFHNLDHNVGNLDNVQIADKANFMVYSSFFNSYIVLNKFFILHSSNFGANNTDILSGLSHPFSIHIRLHLFFPNFLFFL